MSKIESILRSKGRSVEIIGPEETVQEAVRRLNGPPRFGALVVCQPGERRLAGMITERDILRGLGRFGATLLPLRVSDVMSHNVPVCSPDEKVTFVMGKMTRTRYRHLPVIVNEEVVGLVSIGDVVKNRLHDMEIETGVLRDLYIARH